MMKPANARQSLDSSNASKDGTPDDAKAQRYPGAMHADCHASHLRYEKIARGRIGLLAILHRLLKIVNGFRAI